MKKFTLNLPQTGGTFYVMKLNDDEVGDLQNDAPDFWEATEIGEEVYCNCTAVLDDEATVTDESGEVIATFDLIDLDDNDLDPEPEKLWQSGLFTFMYQQERGQFGTVEIEDETFDVSELAIYYASFDEVGYDVQFVSKVLYRGKELDVCTDELDTIGKSLQYNGWKTNEWSCGEEELFAEEE